MNAEVRRFILFTSFFSSIAKTFPYVAHIRVFVDYPFSMTCPPVESSATNSAKMQWKVSAVYARFQSKK
jgi:hypothetical protein